jgi:hypothetical protein
VFWRFPEIFVLDVMPFIVVVSAVRLLRQALGGVDAEERRPLFIAVVFSVFALLSVLYQPNASHFGVVGPIWVTLVAEACERLVRRAEAGLRTRIAGPIAALIVLALAGFPLYRGGTLQWSLVADDTAFGRLHFGSQAEVDDIDALRAALRAADVKKIVVYPCGAAVYLVTETQNPTRFQLLIPGYNTAEQFAEVERTLEREPDSFVLRTQCWPLRDQDDPLMPYLRRRYERVAVPRKRGGVSGLALFRRKPDPPSSSGS